MLLRGLIAGIVCLFASVAAAQERIELLTVVGTQSRMVEVDATVRGFGDILNVTPLTDVSTQQWSTTKPVALAGGRYLAWVATSPTQAWDVVAFDRRTKRRFYAGLPLPPRRFPIGLVADPRHPRLFIVAADAPIGPSEIWVVDARVPGVRRLATFPYTVYGPFYAPDADLLFVRTGFTSEIAAIDVATGAEARRFPIALTVGPTVVNAAGSHLWHNNPSAGVQLVDAHTGDILRTSPSGQLAALLLDEERGTVVGVHPDEQRGEFVTTLDAATLAPVWQTRVSAQLPGLYRFVSPLAGRWMTGAYSVRTESRFDGPCNAIVIDAIDPDGTRRATADIFGRLGLPGGTTGCHADAVLVRSPFAPKALVAAVTGSTVDLSWKDPGDTSEFELEFGLVPGQRSGAIRLNHSTRIAIPGVPAGTYYVRVKAINEVGASPPSNEVRVVVQ